MVSLFHREYFTPTADGIELAKVTPASEQNLCPSERFSNQISAASCTGALVAPNIVLTAGHCFKKVADCKDMVVGFDYLLPQPNVMPGALPRKNVFACKRILARENKENGLDYAFIELDRLVHDRPYFQFDLSDKFNPGDPLFIIGHPMGIPAKFAHGMVVEPDEILVQTDLDTYEGNSGSPVFNARTGLIVGVLVEGEEDFVDNGSCKVSKVCNSNNCTGEYVTRIANILESYYQKTNKP
ncbi:MAG TPA: serine protease [Bdellovibrionales bacterium]|nr:serine protease [Bdellovibrionales bacterium]